MPQMNLETKEWEYSTQNFCIGPIKNRKQATNSFSISLAVMLTLHALCLRRFQNFLTYLFAYFGYFI